MICGGMAAAAAAAAAAKELEMACAEGIDDGSTCGAALRSGGRGSAAGVLVSPGGACSASSTNTASEGCTGKANGGGAAFALV